MSINIHFKTFILHKHVLSLLLLSSSILKILMDVNYDYISVKERPVKKFFVIEGFSHGMYHSRKLLTKRCGQETYREICT